LSPSTLRMRSSRQLASSMCWTSRA
jgi:hypothetical protein